MAKKKGKEQELEQARIPFQEGQFVLLVVDGITVAFQKSANEGEVTIVPFPVNAISSRPDSDKIRRRLGQIAAFLSGVNEGEKVEIQSRSIDRSMLSDRDRLHVSDLRSSTKKR